MALDATPASATLGVTEAADLLGKSRQCVRDMLEDGRLTGRLVGRRWEIDRGSVDARLETVGRSQPRVSLSSLATRVARLESRIEEGAPEQSDDMHELARERDQYRTEASSLRAVAIRLNAAIDLQRDALAQLLSPGSLDDLNEMVPQKTEDEG